MGWHIVSGVNYTQYPGVQTLRVTPRFLLRTSFRFPAVVSENRPCPCRARVPCTTRFSTEITSPSSCVARSKKRKRSGPLQWRNEASRGRRRDTVQYLMLTCVDVFSQGLVITTHAPPVCSFCCVVALTLDPPYYSSCVGTTRSSMGYSQSERLLWGISP